MYVEELGRDGGGNGLITGIYSQTEQLSNRGMEEQIEERLKREILRALLLDKYCRDKGERKYYKNNCVRLFQKPITISVGLQEVEGFIWQLVYMVYFIHAKLTERPPMMQD